MGRKLPTICCKYCRLLSWEHASFYKSKNCVVGDGWGFVQSCAKPLISRFPRFCEWSVRMRRNLKESFPFRRLCAVHSRNWHAEHKWWPWVGEFHGCVSVWRFRRASTWKCIQSSSIDHLWSTIFCPSKLWKREKVSTLKLWLTSFYRVDTLAASDAAGKKWKQQFPTWPADIRLRNKNPGKRGEEMRRLVISERKTIEQVIRWHSLIIEYLAGC